MGLKSIHKWQKVGENSYANLAARIDKVDGKYIVTLDLRAKPENRIKLGPFDTSNEAEAAYEEQMAAVATVKTGDWSKGAGGRYG
jgi:hypothetical protein